MKTCTCCKEIKCKSEFNKNKTKKDGLADHCKVCRSNAKKQYRLENPTYFSHKAKVYRENNKEKVNTAAKKRYYTNHETTLKNKNKYQKTYRVNNPDNGKKYYADNRVAILESQKTYRVNNPALVKLRIKKWHDKNIDRMKEYNKKWVKENLEKVKAIQRNYRLKNPDNSRVANHRRRALILKCGGVFTSKDIQILLLDQQGECVYCKKTLLVKGKVEYHIDHYLPLFLGGSNDPANLQLLCPNCNLSKSAKHPEEYERLIGYTCVSNTDVSLLKENAVNEL